MDDFREFLKKLPGKISKKNMDAIVEHVEALMPPEIVKTVEVVHARLAVEDVHIHGLRISLDASRNAVFVHFPYVAQVIS